jgi:hypothetical protein
MAWDLGIASLLALGALSIAVGLLVQLMGGSEAPDWLWVRVAAVYFVIGAWLTDAWFGWASAGQLTVEDVVLVGLAPVPAVLLVARSMSRRGGRGRRRRARSSGVPRPTARPL